MNRIIKNRAIVDDEYTLLTLPADAAADAAEHIELPAGPLLVPLAVWRARADELRARGTPVGVWLDVAEDPETIAADLDRLPVVGVNFPKFTDGRGYSTARLLRQRYGYAGEIRAIGDVLHDQLFLMTRCGFDAFALKPGKDLEKALTFFATFKEPYQAAVDQTLPLFRRRAA